MTRAPYALAALTALAVFAGPAHATGCPLLTDPAGDVGPGSLAPVPVEGPVAHSLDIVSADVASGPTSVVAVLRVRSLTFDPFAHGLSHWAFGWAVDGTGYGVIAGRGLDASGLSFRSDFHGPGGFHTPVPVAVDEAAGTFTWTLPRSLFAELATPGATFDGFHARASESFTFMGDFAGHPHNATPAYVDGTPGCVPAS